ncbi:alcohol dehydrogenase [Embleya scabrispora]|uniref:Alcohol dehydrogenase n=1 Tax=Embleya scabrispora TaxID=159449 RepID=A0A1T3P4T4_9ACTN|nr:aldo/keto reductase [Embleya scabrispora]OPC84096.1 alcohol dehydrogenase [Embleya scabrispora]
MTRPAIADLTLFPMALGGNVFGWTADQDESFAVMDAYAEAGGNFIDTADSYSKWAPGNSGGESEEIIGKWMKARGNRADMVIATKVGAHPEFTGIAPRVVAGAVEQSLRRLQTDYIDLYYTHNDDPGVPVEDFLGALDRLVAQGKVRHIGASNISAERLTAALAASERDGSASYVVLQHHYNLMERDRYEGGLRNVVAAHGLATAPYYALAGGFLTGKYRPGTTVDSPRSASAVAYLNSSRGGRVLAALDTVARAHGASVTAVALAWLAAQPTVTVPIASARDTAQLADQLAFLDIALEEAEVQLLSAASEATDSPHDDA